MDHWAAFSLCGSCVNVSRLVRSLNFFGKIYRSKKYLEDCLVSNVRPFLWCVCLNLYLYYKEKFNAAEYVKEIFTSFVVTSWIAPQLRNTGSMYNFAGVTTTLMTSRDTHAPNTLTTPLITWAFTPPPLGSSLALIWPTIFTGKRRMRFPSFQKQCQSFEIARVSSLLVTWLQEHWCFHVGKNFHNNMCRSIWNSLPNKPFVLKTWFFTSKLLHLTVRKMALSDLNLTLPVQFPHPTQAVVEFPTPLAQVMGGLPRGGCEFSIWSAL